jgi:hypothetical protein
MKLDAVVCLFFSLIGIPTSAQGRGGGAKCARALIQRAARRGREDS